MRTTVDIENSLLERAKSLALKEKQTLGAVVTEALTAYLGNRKTAGKDPPFVLLVRGSTEQRFPSAAELQAVEEEDDVGGLGMPEMKHRATP